MHTGKLVILLALSALVLPARNDRGAISGKVANPEGIVRIVATSLNTGEKLSSVADSAGGFTLASLAPGVYRVTFRNDAGTAFARRELTVRAGQTLRLNARLEAVHPPRIDGRRAAPRRVATAAAADLPPMIQQFQESSRYMNAVVLVDDNHGWAVGEPRWDQPTRTTKGTIISTTNGGVTWTNQDPGVAVALHGVFFLNSSQGWVVGDNGTILRTSDGGAHWIRQPVASQDYFASVVFTDALNGWAASDAATQYDEFDYDYQATIWHSTDGGQTWTPQTLPASASFLNRIVFVNANIGFAAGYKPSGYDGFGNPAVLGAIYGTTNGGQTWNEIFATNSGLTFTSLYFTDASNGWASGFALASDSTDPCTFHTADGGKTWQANSLDADDPFYTQVRDIHMLDANRGYAVGTAYETSGTVVWRTLDGGATWRSIRMSVYGSVTDEGYWGLAATANRILIVGDRDATAFASDPWDTCATDDYCPGDLFTQAFISPHYIFNGVAFTDRNHGWAAGTFSFNSQLWGQEIFATQDGGQTWTSQFERSLTSGPPSQLRLDSISFADANNGWAAGNSGSFLTASGYNAELGCILHTADGGKTWTDQGASICTYDSGEFVAIQAIDAQNVWALSDTLVYSGEWGTVQLAHSTDGGNTWTMVNTGITSQMFAGGRGSMRFGDTRHGCFAVTDLVGCTKDGGATWTQATLNCGEDECFLNSNAVTFANSLDGWIAGSDSLYKGVLYQTTDSGADWTRNTPVLISGPPGMVTKTIAVEAIQFPAASAGWASGDEGVLYQTTDAGEDWQSVDSGTGYDLLGLSFTDPTHGWIVGDYGTILSYSADRNPAGMPAVFAAVNAASYTNQTAPAAWISIFGANLSATARAWAASDFVNGKLPTKLDGVSVLVNGNLAYLSYISPGQINAMFPDDGSSGQVSVQVVNAAGASGTLPVQKAAYSPSLFRLSSGNGQSVIAQDSHYNLLQTAKPGEIVTLYGTGFGPTSPAIPSDVAVTGSAQTASPVTFTVGGIAAVVQWAGMIGPGLYQFNVYIPPNAPSGDLVIVAEVAGYFTQGDSAISVGLD